MANDNRQNHLIRMLPDTKLTRKIISNLKIYLANRSALNSSEIQSGENDPMQKKQIVDRCKCKWIKDVEKQNAIIEILQKTINNSSVSSVLIENYEDVLFCYFAYGFTADEYFVFKLNEKGQDEREAFISARLRLIFRCCMNDLFMAHIFNDKAETYGFFREFYRREAIAIEYETDYASFEEFVKEHPIFVKKAVYLAQGHSVELIDINHYNMSHRELFNSLIEGGKHILEEKIVQTAEMSAFNESSVNTVRCITFNTKNGIVVPYCTIRTGRPGAFVDNGGAGGIQAVIDYNTGIICTDGYDELGGSYQRHPASKTVFKGYSLPDWQQLQDLLATVANRVPMVKFIGWDLAHTKDGWVIVEGNENCYIIAKQMIEQKGIRKIFEDLMGNMDLVV